MRISTFVRLLLLVCLPVVTRMTASGQILITNGVQTYTALTNVTVTMSNVCELHVTGTNAPLTGCTINLNSVDSILVLPGITPSVVQSTYLAQIFVNGAAAVAGSNSRVVEYAMGAIVLPQPSTLQPLTIYSAPYFNGVSMSLGQYTYYTSALGTLYGNISSFKLKRGYAAVLAQTIYGTGMSQCYIAQDGDLNVSLLPAGFDHSVVFVYVVPWRWTSKKGIAGNPGISLLTVQSWYDWNIDQNSTANLEYVPIRAQRYWPSLGQNWSSRGSDTVLGYNEPDSSSQANMAVGDAIYSWPDLLGTGLRTGSPACTDGGVSSWLVPFISEAGSNALRVDFVAQHYYQSHNPADPAGCASQLLSFLQNIWNKTHRPIWLTEWNNGANWTDSQWPVPTYAQQQACVAAMINMLDTTPFVERYHLYNWVEDGRSVVNTNGVLTPAGVTYAAEQSPVGYMQALQPNGTRGIAQLSLAGNALDSSGYGNNGITAGSPAYTNGVNGQAAVFDGANTYITLPPNVATNSAFSFAAWINWSGGANWQRIFDFGADSSHYLFLTPNSGSNFRFAINSGGGEQQVNAPALASGVWTHVAVTLSGNTATLYTNGVIAAQNTSMSITPAGVAPCVYNRLGKSQFYGDPLFQGAMDDVLVTDYALSAAQITALMTNTPPQFTNSIIAGGNATEAVPYSYSIAGSATNLTGSTLVYGMAAGPAWLSVAANGTVTGTPTAGNGGTNYLTVIATDPTGESAYALLAIVVKVTTTNGTWTADASDIWSNTNDWANDTVASGVNETADFSTINITANRTVTLDASHNIGTLKFGDTSGGQSWTLTNSAGSALTLNTGSATSPSIVVNQNTATIAAPLAGTNGFTKSAAGSLILSGYNSLSGILYVDTGSTSANDGIVCAASPAALAGITAIQIRNNNSGTSTFQLDGSLGGINTAANVVLLGRNNSVLSIENLDGTNTLGSLSLNVGGSSYLIQSDSGLLNWNGTMSSLATGTRTITFQGSGNHVASGVITEGSAAVMNVVKTGSGSLTLGALNTYMGTTTVSGGQLVVDGAIGTNTLSLSGGTTLGGSGVIYAPVVVPSGVTLAPGDNSIGTLAVNNNVTLNSGSTTLMGVNSTNAINAGLLVSGKLTYGGTLLVTNSGNPLVAGNSFALFNAGGMLGNFSSSNLPALGAGLVWNFNQVAGVLSVAPATNTAPTISSVSNQTLSEYPSNVTVAVTVADADAPVNSLTLSGTSSNPTLVPASNIVFGGSGANRTVTITPLPNQFGNATITLAVSDGLLSQTTSFLLTVTFVNHPPTITSIPNQTWGKNMTIGPLAFTANDPDTGPASVILTAASSNPALIPTGNIVFASSGANRTVTITPVTNMGGTSTITMTASDGVLTTNTSFVVTVGGPVWVGKANNTTSLNSGSSWTSGVVPASNSVALWNSTVTAANTVALGANLNWAGLSISNPAGPVTISAGNTLTLGASGIDMSMAGQNLAINSGLALAPGNQSWNVTNGRTLTVTGAFGRTGPGATLVIPGNAGTVAFVPPVTNGILGPWAVVSISGTAANNSTNGYTYATTNSGNIVSYTNATSQTAFNWTSGNPNTQNYDVSGTTTALGVNRTANTVRYTGAAATQDYGSSDTMTLTINGLMNAGTGTLTLSQSGGSSLGQVQCGVNNELVLNAANAGLAITIPIIDGSAASVVTINSAGNNLVVLSGTNTFSGGTIVNGSLQLGAPNIIPNGSGKGNLMVNGTLDLNTNNQTVNGLSGSGTIDTIAGGTPTLTVGGNNASSTFNGIIQDTAGALALTATGSGILTLASGNLYTGNTTIGTGGGASVLRATATQALGTGTIIFDPTGNGSTARLEITNNIVLTNPTTFSGRNNASVGIESTGGTNAFSGAITMTSGGSAYIVQSDNGSLVTLGNPGTTAITASASNARTVTLQGAGNGVVLGNIIDGTGVGVTLTGSGTWALYGTNTYSGNTTVNAGQLLLGGFLLGAGTVTVNSPATLAGNGVINGPVVIQSGGMLAPGGGIGILTCSNNVTLNTGSTNLMTLNRTLGTNSQLWVGGALAYAGTLVVTNLSGTLQGGDTFQLFNAGSETGNFSTLAGTPGNGRAWKFNSNTGVLTVYSTVSTNLSYSFSNNLLSITWPSDHIGWTLQCQTNSLNTGLGTNWISIANSASSTNFTAPVDASQPSVFYRLIYQ